MSPYPRPLKRLGLALDLAVLTILLAMAFLFEATPADQQERVRKRINRIDPLCQRGACVGLGIWAVLAWLL